MKFIELATDFIQSKRGMVKESTISSYIYSLNTYILPVLGENNAIEKHDITNLITSYVENGYSRRTAIMHIALLKSILDYGNYNGVFDSEKIHVEYPKVLKDSVEMCPLSDIEAIELSAYCFENFTFTKLPILLSLYLGLRIGEIRGLRWKDIDLDRSTASIKRTVCDTSIYDKKLDKKEKTSVVVSSPKTSNSERLIPISGDLLILLKKLKRICKNENNYLVTNSSTPEGKETIRKHLKKVLKLCNLRDVRFHELRHTFATLCITNGADIKTVSEMLGHACVEITLKTYTHTSLQDKAKAINKVNKIML